MSEQAAETFSLPPRSETWLARYPRKLKLGVTAVLFIAVVAVRVVMPGSLSHTASMAKSLLSASMQSAGQKEKEIAESAVQTDVSAPALNDQNDRSIKLVAAPDANISEDTAQGPLPRIGADGAQPWRVYARPFDVADRRPRVAILVTGLGLSRAITDEFIDQLPPTVTLSFDGQSTVIGDWVTRARQDGHEALLEIPMEPIDYPHSDPGSNTLLTDLPNSDNVDRLQKFMSRTSGYIGITSLSGSRFMADAAAIKPVLQVLHDRGLMIMDAGAAPRGTVPEAAHGANVPAVALTRRIDTNLAPDAIAAALKDLEKTATLTGRAVGIMSPTPVGLEQLQNWVKTLPEHGIALAPISAMVKQ